MLTFKHGFHHKQNKNNVIKTKKIINGYDTV